MMAGDAHDLIGWKRWIEREERATGAWNHRWQSGMSVLTDDKPPPTAPHAVLTQKPLLLPFTESQRLLPVPAYLPASAHLKGVPRHDWARYAGTSGHDPVVGYSTRWAKERAKSKPVPFTNLRSSSTSNLALDRALTPLNIKPVVRKPPVKPPTPPMPQMYKVMSMEDLAPDLGGPLGGEIRGRKTTEFNSHDSSQMMSFMAAHVGM